MTAFKLKIKFVKNLEIFYRENDQGKISDSVERSGGKRIGSRIFEWCAYGWYYKIFKGVYSEGKLSEVGDKF